MYLYGQNNLTFSTDNVGTRRWISYSCPNLLLTKMWVHYSNVTKWIRLGNKLITNEGLGSGTQSLHRVYEKPAVHKSHLIPHYSSLTSSRIMAGFMRPSFRNSFLPFVLVLEAFSAPGPKSFPPAAVITIIPPSRLENRAATFERPLTGASSRTETQSPGIYAMRQLECALQGSPRCHHRCHIAERNTLRILWMRRLLIWDSDVQCALHISKRLCVSLLQALCSDLRRHNYSEGGETSARI